MESYGSTRADRDKPKLLGEEAKHPGVNSPARPRGSSPNEASRLGFNAPWQTAMYDGMCQLPSTVTLFCTSPCAPPLLTIKGRGRQRLQGLDLHRIKHHLPGLGPTPSPDHLVTPSSSTLSSGTRQHCTGRRVLLLRGQNQDKSHCLLR
jgi:hypothetical protein